MEFVSQYSKFVGCVILKVTSPWKFLVTVAIILIFVSYSAGSCNFVSFPFVVLVYPACGRHGDLTASALVSGSSSLGSSPGQGHCVVFTLTVSLSTQVYKWVPGNIILG